MTSRLWKRMMVLGLVLALLVVVFQMALALPVDPPVAISPLVAGMTSDGVPYDLYDIVVREGYPGSYTWWKLFDGEEFGLGPKHDIMSMSIDGYYGFGCELDCVDTIAMSFGQDAIKVPGITGKVLGQDLVTFTPVLSGSEVIGGDFEMFFDGSDVGLTTNGEKIEGLDVAWPVVHGDAVAPDDCLAGILYINTLSNYRVPAANGGSLVGTGGDVLIFCATNLGPATAGFWFRGFDESDFPLNPPNAMNGLEILYTGFSPVAVEDEAAVLDFYFTNRLPFTNTSLTGIPGEVYGFNGFTDTYYGPVTDLNDMAALNGIAGAFDMRTFTD